MIKSIMENQTTQTTHITELLMAWNNGDEGSLDKLIPLVEQELRRIAHNYMRKESSMHTLQTTALINEAYIQLNDQRFVDWKNRAHFFALSSQIMRRILMNHARDKKCQKRGGGVAHVDLEKVSLLSPEKNAQLLALDEALERLAEFDSIKSKIVEMRYFGGMTVTEVADVLGLAPVTIAVHWRLAKAWLRTKIR
jgi:RNA polymerase sigma factor (TIGR02999 family)